MDEAGAGVLLLTLLRQQAFFAGWEEEKAGGRCRRLFADPAARELMGCHWSGDDEWFVKERFEHLLGWLLMAAVVTENTTLLSSPDSLLAAVTTLLPAVDSLCRTAAMAGYRTDRFLASLTGEEPERGPEPRDT